MKKADKQGYFYLIIIILVVILVAWLHEQVGTLGLIIAVIVVISAVILGLVQKTKRRQKAFDKIALNVLHNQLDRDEAKGIFREVRKWDFNRMSLLRNLQILADSINLATKSKKRDTAESRMTLAMDRYNEIIQTQISLVTQEVQEEIKTVVEKAQRNFQTLLYINIAEGHIEKAENLKTVKGKRKYLDLAMESIQEGISTGEGDLATLNRVNEKIEQKLNDLGD